MTAPAISLRGVSKLYHRETRDPTSLRAHLGRRDREEFWALRDVSFEVQPGEVVGLVGPNGSGKSTLLKLVAGTIHPTTGAVEVNGRVAPLLALTPGFAPRLSGRENVHLMAALFGLGSRETDALYSSIVEWAELEEFMHTPVEHYSSGMQARLGFSVAMHLQADILLVDEILSVGDARFRAKCEQMIADKRRAGVTVVVVSHNPALVASFCQRRIVIEHGVLQSDERIAPAADLPPSLD